MSILLTGGAGYIGSHTAVELLNAGYSVVIVDDFSNSSPEAVKRVEEITGKNVKLYRADVADKAAMKDLFSQDEIEAVIHFAGFKAVGESVAKPLMYYRNNLDSTFTLLECMKEAGVSRIIFSSSATVYGSPDRTPIVETDRTGNCSNPYGWTKWMIEQILQDTAKADPSLSCVLLRYFNPVGAHESGRIGEMPNGVPNNLMPYITQVAVGLRHHLSVFGNDYDTPDGTGVRDYIHVVDLAKGHLAALRYAMDHTGCEAVNLGTGIGYSVLDMVNSFVRVNNVAVPYEIAPRRSGDIAKCFADPAKAREMLGWEATKTLDDMCRDSWNWQSQNPKGYEA